MKKDCDYLKLLVYSFRLTNKTDLGLNKKKGERTVMNPKNTEPH